MTIQVAKNVKNHETEAEAAEHYFIRQKILHVLSIFPALSPSGIQVAIGPYTQSVKWRPVLRQLVDENHVLQDEVSLEAPDGRVRTYTRYYLPTFVPPQPEELSQTPSKSSYELTTQARNNG